MNHFKKPYQNDNLKEVIAAKQAEKSLQQPRVEGSTRSLKTSSFNKAFDNLPKDIQELAIKNFVSWKKDHNSIKMKPLGSSDSEVWSAEVNFRYRALGVKGLDKDHKSTYVWFWIGSHEDYNKLVSRRDNVATNISNIRKKYLTGTRESRDNHKMTA